MILKMKKNSIYILVFCFFFVSLWYFGSNKNTWDSIWNYGFSLAIAKGQIPYLDFTMVITPLYNMIMAIGLLFSHEYIIYIIEQSILLTICFYFLHQIYEKKAWIYLTLFVIPYYYPLIPSYNTFLFVLLSGILYLEKKEKDHFLIGFLIACMVLTKQTVGIFFLIPSIVFYWKKWNVLKKRILGFFIPIGLFAIYLIGTRSLIAFIDLCILGLLDFGIKNTIWNNGYFWVSGMIFFMNVIAILKQKKNIVLWYALMGYTVLIPIYATYHFQVYLLFCFLCIMELKVRWDVLFRNLSIFIIFFQSALYGYINQSKSVEIVHNIHNFQFIFLMNGQKETIEFCRNLYLKYKRENKNTYFLSNQTSWILSVTEEKYDYFSVLNQGNFGYGGSQKMIQKIKKMKNAYFMINAEEVEEAKSNPRFHQLDIEIIQYVMDHSELIEEKEMYKVYHYSIK